MNIQELEALARLLGEISQETVTPREEDAVLLTRRIVDQALVRAYSAQRQAKNEARAAARRAAR